MRIERTRNATRNIIFGGAQKVYQMLMPFIMRTIMIYVLGINYLGLNSLFTSVLQVLNMAEMGVGLAMVFSMYEPIAKDDKKTVCALMRLYKIYYRIIGFVVFVGGIIIIPILPSLIKSDIPKDINIYILYFLNLFATVTTYWLFAYKHSLLYAHQRSDVATIISIITETIKYILQIVSIVVFKNYYLYTLIIVITQIITNIVTAMATSKMYPEYKADGKLTNEEVKKINNKIRDLFTSKVGTVVFNSVDTIIISAFLGLSILAIYQNYYYIVTSITSLVSIIFTSCVAGIGNSLIIESDEKNYNDFKKFTLLIVWIAGFCTVCMLCLYQPFMEIWVTEKLMLDNLAVYCFCIYFFVNQINLLFESYKDAAGMWHEDRFRPLILAILNLIVNIVLVQYIGIYGVLIASCITKGIVGIPWILYNIFTVIFKRSPWQYIKTLLKEVIVVVLVCIVVYNICGLITIQGIIGLGIKLVMCCLFGNVLFILFFRKKEEYSQLMSLIEKILPRKISKIIKYIR